MLEELGIGYEIRIISAHREPDVLIEWAGSAQDRGIRVIVAGAGMAAALPGMCAALSVLPVIGVPLFSAHAGHIVDAHGHAVNSDGIMFIQQKRQFNRREHQGR